MTDRIRPFRSVLYIPGSNERALEKAKGLAADAIIFDLEDAVAPAEKPAARERLRDALGAGGYGDRSLLVRINGFDTPWGADDLAALATARADAILMPKMGSAAQAADLADRMGAIAGYETWSIWSMIETSQGILNAGEIARAPRMAGFVLGTNDLVAELRCQPGADRGEIQSGLQISLLAARAAGIVAVDGVYNAFRDEDGLRAEAAQGRALGFDGKSLIHPAQIGPVNEVFSPSGDEIDLARRQIAAFEEAEAAGSGVAVLDGKIVENLHVATARRVLAIADALEG